jgi:hypothetical protein
MAPKAPSPATRIDLGAAERRAPTPRRSSSLRPRAASNRYDLLGGQHNLRNFKQSDPKLKAKGAAKGAASKACDHGGLDSGSSPSPASRAVTWQPRTGKGRYAASGKVFFFCFIFFIY